MPRNGSIDIVVESTGSNIMIHPLKKALVFSMIVGIGEASYFLMPPLTSIYLGETSADLGLIGLHAAALLAAIATGYNLSIAAKNGLDEKINGVYQEISRQFKPPEKLVVLNHGFNYAT